MLKCRFISLPCLIDSKIWFLGPALVFEGEETMIAALAENPSGFKVKPRFPLFLSI